MEWNLKPEEALMSILWTEKEEVCNTDLHNKQWRLVDSMIGDQLLLLRYFGP
jgi:hypothetical protein